MEQLLDRMQPFRTQHFSDSAHFAPAFLYTMFYYAREVSGKGLLTIHPA